LRELDPRLLFVSRLAEYFTTAPRLFADEDEEGLTICGP
jgi:hypothetical protein